MGAWWAHNLQCIWLTGYLTVVLLGMIVSMTHREGYILVGMASSPTVQSSEERGVVVGQQRGAAQLGQQRVCGGGVQTARARDEEVGHGLGGAKARRAPRRSLGSHHSCHYQSDHVCRNYLSRTLTLNDGKCFNVVQYWNYSAYSVKPRLQFGLHRNWVIRIRRRRRRRRYFFVQI